MLLFNPLLKDFTVTYDVKGDRAVTQFTAKAGRITKFADEVIGPHVKKHLITAILNDRNLPNFDQNRADVEAEIVKTV